MQNRKLERKRMMEELVRKDILDSTVALLLETGIKAFTMDRVASGAGLAKGTVYLYFKNKQELLDSLVSYCFQPLEKEYQTIAGGAFDPTQKLEQYVMETLNFAETHKQLFTELRNVMFSTVDQYICDKRSWYWETVNLFASTLDEGVAVGKLRPVNSKKVAALYLDAINSLMAHRILLPVTTTVQEDVDELMGLIIKGLAK